jgi:uncharacterized protein (TIRG00374 family)
VKLGWNRILRGAIVAAVLVALVFFARTIEWRETWQAVRSVSVPLLAAAALVNLLSLVLKGIRWWIFLRPIGVRSMWLAVRATFAGAAINNLLIANSGEAARVVLVTRASDAPSSGVLATLALERLFEFIGYVMLLAASVSLLSLPPEISYTRPYAFTAFVLLMALLVYLVRHPERAEVPVLEVEGLLSRARHYGRRFLRTLTNISTTRRFVPAMLISIAVWATQVASYVLTAQAARFPLSIVGTIAAVLAVNIGFAVRTTPGNVGVFQMIYAMTAAAFGLDKDQAIGVGLLIQAQQILPTTILGLLAAPRLIFERPAQPA